MVNILFHLPLTVYRLPLLMIQLLTYNNLHEHSDKIAHFSSTRIGGISTGTFDSLNLGEYTQDAPANIQHNRKLLAAKLGISSNQIYNAHQVHETSVKLVDYKLTKLTASDRKAALQGFDAFICNIPGVCITVTTADCVPIFLYDPQQKAVAAIHSGWKSTLHNIVLETIRAMHIKFGTQACNLVAAIGPCISQPVYEVGEEMFVEFKNEGFDTAGLFEAKPKGKYLFDIRKAVRLQLVEVGVTNIEISPYCTYTDEELFFSARRQGTNSGRMLNGILIR